MKYEPTVLTPSGGFHVYMYLPEDYDTVSKKIHKKLNEYPGIDFLSRGAQCVIPGSKTDKGEYTWYDDLFGEFQTIEAPETLIDIVSYTPVLKLNGSASDDLDMLVGNSTWSEEKVKQFLSKLDPSIMNDEWVKVGMALHDWHPVAGLELWEEWSKDGDNYKEGETEKL